MAVKKSELYSSLWSSCDELRGGMDAGQYKDYVLAMLFIKYVSDKYAGVPFAQIKVPAGASFKDMIALKGTSDIGDQINKKIIGPLEKANNLSFGGVDFNDTTKLGDGKEKVDRLTNLIGIFQNPALDFSKNRAEGDDLLGDAYEYLMRHFATESGKSKGQFYTPAEVSRVIAQVLGIRYADTTNKTTVYDPTCGSGSLLLKVGDEASHEKDVRVTLYGQEKDNATAGLARMNMILHDYATAEIKQGNTLTTPLFKNGEVLETFDYVVANPPFSDKRWSTGLDAEKDEYERFQHYGVPPKKQGDYAYLLHILRSMKAGGKGACILPHGVLFRGGAEGTIRRNLIQYGYIKGIIGLPANLFYGTGIPACIIVLDKEGASARKGIFMIDASKGFRKDGPKNRLREQDLHKIVDTFLKQAELSRYSRLVPVTEISDQRNDYNLNLPRYIDSTEPEDLQDIDGHLRGGIPERDIDALQSYWDVIPGVRAAIFKDFDRPGYYQLTVPVTEVKSAIFSHNEFTTFNDSVNELFAKWKKKNSPLLKGFSKGGRPKVLIETIAEDLLTAFRGAPLLDEYDIYQHLMDYWSETMQDDCYLIAGDGWREAAQPRLIVEDKSKKNKTKPDFVVGKKKYQTELIPPALIIRRWFADEQCAMDHLESDIAAIQQEMEVAAEEHGGEEGLLADAKNDKDKLTKASVMARLKEITDETDADEERNKLYDYLALIKREAETSETLWEAQGELIEKVAAKYAALTEDEVKMVVVDDKWLATIAAAVQGELDRVSQTLTGRIRQLAERYAVTLPQLIDGVAALGARVDGHLRKMGAVWK
jgi:type I restriction enzyme M protein